MATQAEIDAAMERIGKAKPRTSFGDRVRDGRHLLALQNYEIRDTDSEGLVQGIDLVVVKSDAHAVGSLVSVAFWIGKRGWQGEAELSKASAAGRAILGIPAEATDQQVKEQLNKLRSEAQPGTGLLVWATGRTNSPRQSKAKGAAPGDMTKEYTEVTFSHEPDQGIKEPSKLDGKLRKDRRTEIEASHPRRGAASDAKRLQTLPKGMPPGYAVPEGWQLHPDDVVAHAGVVAAPATSMLDGLD